MRKIGLSLLTFIVLNVVSFTQSQSNELTVIASHSILANVIENIVGTSAKVETLIPLGADPHAFQPSSRDLTRLATADVIFINGALFEEGLLDTIENVATEIPIITASSCIEIRLFASEDNEHDDEHDEEETHIENELLKRQCDGHYDELGLTLDTQKHRLHELDCGDDHA